MQHNAVGLLCAAHSHMSQKKGSAFESADARLSRELLASTSRRRNRNPNNMYGDVYEALADGIKGDPAKK